MDQIRAMMRNLRNELPIPCPAVQFSGGEPTVRDDLPEIVSMAREMGFAQIQIATNGLRLAASVDLCRSLEKSGLNTVYLQFDGVTAQPYQAARGRDLFPIKLKALENFRKSGLTSVVLVPTLAKGVMIIRWATSCASHRRVLISSRASTSSPSPLREGLKPL